MNIIRLIFQGSVALLREVVSRVSSGIVRFERGGLSQLAAFPAGLLEGCVLFARGVVQGGREGGLVFAFFVLFLLLFLLLQ